MLTRITDFIAKISRITDNGDTQHRVEVNGNVVEVYISNVLVASFDSNSFDVVPNSITKNGVEVATVNDIAAITDDFDVGTLDGFRILVNDPSLGQFTIEDGIARGIGDVANIVLGGSITKTTSNYATGTGLGGKAAGATLPVSGIQWMSVWAIVDAGGTVDIVFDDNEDGTNVDVDPNVVIFAPVDKRRIGYMIYSGGAGNWIPVRQEGDDFYVLNASAFFTVTDFASYQAGDYGVANGKLVDTPMPPNTIATFNHMISANPGAITYIYGIATHPSQGLSSITPDLTQHNYFTIITGSAAGYNQVQRLEIPVDDTSRFRFKIDNVPGALGEFRYQFVKWTDKRGKR